MTAPVSLGGAARLFGVICLCAGFASASVARDGAMTVAQNPPTPAPPGQGEQNPKEHKKDHGEKGQQQQKGPQGAAPGQNPSAGKGQPGPG